MYGLCRSADKLNGLASQEIISIVGSIEDSTEYLKVIERENIDVVVDFCWS